MREKSNHLPTLHHWYKAHGRQHLPWRNTADPYHILVSEVMLQQTQVKTVLERFYQPFLNAFPTLTSLSKADIHDVLRYWQGLGYYNRAVNLHKTAQITAPVLPETVTALMQLPGIGRNTAHAVAAFAYRQPVPIMEANVKRILHRVFAKPALTEKELWNYAEALLDKENPFDYNQSMMDIGAMVCTPTQPQCLLCPLAGICEGKHQPEAFPTPKPKKVTPTRRKTIVVFSYKDTKGIQWYYMEKRESRFLHGLYRFAEYDSGKPVTFYNHRYGSKQLQPLGNIVKIYSHFRLEADVYTASVEEKEGNEWYEASQISTLPVSGAEEKIYGLLKKY